MLHDPRRTRPMKRHWVSLIGPLRAMRAGFKAWRRRRRREQLISELPPYLLYDIGIIPDETGRRKYRAPRPSRDDSRN